MSLYFTRQQFVILDHGIEAIEMDREQALICVLHTHETLAHKVQRPRNS